MELFCASFNSSIQKSANDTCKYQLAPYPVHSTLNQIGAFTAIDPSINLQISAIVLLAPYIHPKTELVLTADAHHFIGC